MDQQLEDLERAIKAKIDAIFEDKISDNRFVRSSSTKVQPALNSTGAHGYRGQPGYFYDRLTKERRKVRELMDLLPKPAHLRRINSEGVHEETLEMVENVEKVGQEISLLLERLLRLTQQVIENTAV